MSGMRLTLQSETVVLPISRYVQAENLQKKVKLPITMLAYEPAKSRHRALELWNTQVLKTMAELIQTRKSVIMNKHMRRCVFRTGMEKLLIRFNQHTENIKVEFGESHVQDRKPTSLKYMLTFFRLSPIADSVRYAPSCAAEIPDPTAMAERVASSTPFGTYVLDAHSEWYGRANENTGAVGVPDPAANVPMVVATAVALCSPIDHCDIESSSESNELAQLRNEVNELRIANTILQSQLDARSSIQIEGGESSQVRELRQEISEIRQLMQQMLPRSG